MKIAEVYLKASNLDEIENKDADAEPQSEELALAV